MEKKIYEYRKQKVVNLHGETNVIEGERKFGNILVCISFFLTILTWILVFGGILNFFMMFVPFILPILFLLYLTVKYLFIKKIPMKYESYDIEVNGDDTNISNYKEKVINGDDQNNIDNEYLTQEMPSEQKNKNGYLKGLLYSFGMVGIIFLGVCILSLLKSIK